MQDEKTDWNDFLANWNGDKPSLVEATGQLDYPSALLFLYGKGARHPDMDRYGIIDTKGQSSTDFNVTATDSLILQQSGLQAATKYLTSKSL